MNHKDRLIQKLGEPSNWIYFKSDSLGGECACGKKNIVYRNHLRNRDTSETVIVGSECINYFEGNQDYTQLVNADKQNKKDYKFRQSNIKMCQAYIEYAQTGLCVNTWVNQCQRYVADANLIKLECYYAINNIVDKGKEQLTLEKWLLENGFVRDEWTDYCFRKNGYKVETITRQIRKDYQLWHPKNANEAIQILEKI